MESQLQPVDTNENVRSDSLANTELDLLPLESTSQALAQSVRENKYRVSSTKDALPMLENQSIPSTDRRKYSDTVRPHANTLNVERNAISTCPQNVSEPHYAEKDVEAVKWKKRYERKKDALSDCQKSFNKYHEEAERNADQLQQRNEKLQDEVTTLQARLDALQTAHVKAVNSVGSGLEPISDQELVEKLVDFHYQANSFFRRVFKGRKICGEDENITKWLLDHQRCSRPPEACGFTTGNTLELLIWAHLEMIHTTRWFSSDNMGQLHPLQKVEELVRHGGRLPIRLKSAMLLIR